MEATTQTRPARRMSADERREDIVRAAVEEFALHGLYGTAVDAIARRAGITQPYVFRLFGTKKDLFVAVVERCFRATSALFERAAADAPKDGVLEAIGDAYGRELLADRTMLQAQMQAYAACGDPDVRVAVRRGFRDLYALVHRLSGASPEEMSAFFATGMLLNVAAAMDLPSLEEPWAADLLGPCAPGAPAG